MSIDLSKHKLPVRVRLRGGHGDVVVSTKIFADNEQWYLLRGLDLYVDSRGFRRNDHKELPYDIIEILRDSPKDEEPRKTVTMKFIGFIGGYRMNTISVERESDDKSAVFSIPLAHFDKLPESMKKEIEVKV